MQYKDYEELGFFNSDGATLSNPFNLKTSKIDPYVSKYFLKSEGGKVSEPVWLEATAG